MSREKFPEFFIQCDWNLSLAEGKNKVWVSLKGKDKAGIHGFIQINGASSDSTLTSSDGFKIITFEKNSLHVGHESTGRTAIFLAPVKSISKLHEKSVWSVSVNALGHAVTAGADEKLLIWDTLTEKRKLDIKGHVGDVYKCRYFPSGEVVITCGSDMKLIIWCAKTGTKAATLVGHTMAVTDVDFVDRGKNVISTSKDGTLKLWNCGDCSCLATVFKHTADINCCKIFNPTQQIEMGEPDGFVSEKECGTVGKAVLLGCEDGLVHCIALSSRKKMYSALTSSAVNCVDNVDNLTFVVGCQDGSIHLYSLLDSTSSKKSWHSSNSAVYSICVHKSIGFFTARADGTVTFIFFNISNVSLNLTGADAEPIYQIIISSDHIYSCSRDAIIRVYSPFKLINRIMGKGN